MAITCFGPGGENITLGSETDKWAGVNAKNATIDTFKNVGNASTPVYFDANGIPRPVTSSDGSGNNGDSTPSSISWEGITNKPTTLVGYGITDAQSAMNLSIVDGQICMTYDE